MVYFSHMFILFKQTGFFAQIIFFLLLSLSVIGWAFFFSKAQVFYRLYHQNKEFFSLFSSITDNQDLLLKSQRYPTSIFARLFLHLFIEVKAYSFSLKKDFLERKFHSAYLKEVDSLNKFMFFFSASAHLSPFIGLLGTVWGILSAFEKIGSTGNANLATVAPGIAEALITTACGLLVAIPSAAMHHFFSAQISRMKTQTECFLYDLLNRFESFAPEKNLSGEKRDSFL